MSGFSHRLGYGSVLLALVGLTAIAGCGSTEDVVAVEPLPEVSTTLPAQVSLSDGSYLVSFTATVPNGISATSQAVTVTWGFAGAPPLTQETFSASEVGCSTGQTFCQQSFVAVIPTAINAVNAEYLVTFTLFDRQGLAAIDTNSVFLAD